MTENVSAPAEQAPQQPQPSLEPRNPTAPPSVQERIAEKLSRAHGLLEPAPEAPTEEAAPEPESEQPAPEQDESEPEKSAESEQEPGGDENAPETGDDADSIEVGSLEDLARHNGLAIEDIYSLPIKVGDGEVSLGDLTLGKWRDEYTQAKRQTEKEISEARQTFERESEAARQQLVKHLNEAASLLEIAEKQLTEEFEGINWSALRAEDPAEYAARRGDFERREAQIRFSKGELQRNAETAGQEYRQQQEQALAKHLAAEQDALIRALPEWGDPDKAEGLKADIGNYMRSLELSDDEQRFSTHSHRMMLVLRKAMLYDKQQKTADVTKKKVVKIARKPMQPGAKQNRNATREDAMSRARTRARNTQRMDDHAEVIARKLGRLQ